MTKLNTAVLKYVNKTVLIAFVIRQGLCDLRGYLPRQKQLTKSVNRKVDLDLNIHETGGNSHLTLEADRPTNLQSCAE